jgi:hypothetical protein
MHCWQQSPGEEHVKKKERPPSGAQSDDDRAFVVCMPVATGPAIAGSTQRNCSECTEPIWVSPATFRSVKQFPDRRFVCIHCALKLADFQQSLQAPTEAQMEELRSNLPQSNAPSTQPPKDSQQILHEMKELFAPLQPPAGKRTKRGDQPPSRSLFPN